jgi:small nuclear ribonucleoprotein (snRNP)-like protein
LDQFYKLLHQLLRITVNDGRVFIGTFAGTDKPLNIILINAEEYRIGPGQNPDGRYVGQIMLPWKIIITVEAHVPERPRPLNGMYIWQVNLWSEFVL